MTMRFRKHKKKANLLVAVVGLLCLAIGGLMAMSALFRHEHEQMRYWIVAAWYGSAGAALLILRFLFFRLPDILRARTSPTARRRREHFETMRRPTPSRPPGDDGSVLIVSLILLGLLSTLAFRVLVTARQELALAESIAKTGLLKIAALDATRAAMQRLADDDNLRFDHPSEPWAEVNEITDPAGITRMVRITDLQQRFDLNNLAAAQPGLQLPVIEAISRIMTECGILTPGSQVAALRDWVDSDETGVYEKSLYATRTPPYQPADRILYGFDDLFLVDGWTPALFDRQPAGTWANLSSGDLIDCVTIIPAERSGIIPMNVNTASADALQGLFGPGRQAAVEFLLSRRKAGPITRFDFIAAQLGAADYAMLSPYLDIRSSWFQIDTTTAQDGRIARLQVIARRGDDGQVDAVRAFF